MPFPTVASPRRAHAHCGTRTPVHRVHSPVCVQLHMALSEAVDGLTESLALSVSTADCGARSVCVRLVAVCSETSTSGSAASLWRIEPASEDDARLLRGGGAVTLRLGDGAGVRLAAGGELEPLELHIDAAAEAVHGLFARRATDGAEAPERFLEGELEMLDELLQAEPNRFRRHAAARLPPRRPRAAPPRPAPACLAWLCRCTWCLRERRCC